jgi:IS5 family transposase
LIKTVGNFRRTRYRGVERTSFAAYLVGAAYNLLRIRQALSQRMNRAASELHSPTRIH